MERQARPVNPAVREYAAAVAAGEEEAAARIKAGMQDHGTLTTGEDGTREAAGNG